MVLSLFDMREKLAGAPLYLLIICAFQVILLFLGIFINSTYSLCDLAVSSDGMTLICDTCRLYSKLSWEEVTLLIVGLAVILVGVFASIRRSQTLCRIYGIAMLVYAFSLALTSILTGVQIGALKEATLINQIAYPECPADRDSMIDSQKSHSILYAVNAILDIIGALFAIKSKSLFDYEVITERLVRSQRSNNL